MTSECARLADRFTAMKGRGLVDVKFFLRNQREAAKEAVCAEVNKMLDAFESGECAQLHFGDSQHTA